MPATEWAKGVFGETLTANLIMLGYAYQCEVLPIPHEAIEKAIELNGRDVHTNLAAFRLGRETAADPAKANILMGKSRADPDVSSKQLEDELLTRRQGLLRESHGAKVSAQLSDWVGQARQSIDACYHDVLIPPLVESAFRVLYQKDEYEVARLYSQPKFRESLSEEFGGRFKLRVHLAPPLMSRTDPDSGRPRMRSFGPWVFTVFKVMSALRWVRGKWFDPFRFGEERALQQKIQSDFQRTINAFGETPVTSSNIDDALRLIEWPMQVRGFGPVRAEAFQQARGEIERLESALRSTHGENQ